MMQVYGPAGNYTGTTITESLSSQRQLNSCPSTIPNPCVASSKPFLVGPFHNDPVGGYPTDDSKYNQFADAHTSTSGVDYLGRAAPMYNYCQIAWLQQYQCGGNTIELWCHQNIHARHH